MPMQIRRTLTPDLPPTALAEGQLSVEMASTPPKLWCGVPTAIDASGRVLLTPDPPGLFTPTVSGIVPASGGGTANYLRADGSWAAPPAPAAKQGDVRFDSGRLERWDGTAWQQIVIWPQMGVTDGSNAAPGQVGESLHTSAPDLTTASLALPAGDWDIRAQMCLDWSYISDGQAFTDSLFITDFSSIFAPGVNINISSTDSSGVLEFPIVLFTRASISSPTQIVVNANNPTNYVLVQIWATRMR